MLVKSAPGSAVVFTLYKNHILMYKEIWVSFNPMGYCNLSQRILEDLNISSDALPTYTGETWCNRERLMNNYLWTNLGSIIRPTIYGIFLCSYL